MSNITFRFIRYMFDTSYNERRIAIFSNDVEYLLVVEFMYGDSDPEYNTQTWDCKGPNTNYFMDKTSSHHLKGYLESMKK